MSFPEWQHRYTATRRLDRKKIEVEAGLHYFQGNRRPNFSVTCIIWEQARNNRWIDVGGGAADEEILKAFPKLAPVVALHLSDDDGTPMHALANARFLAGCTKYQEPNAEVLARHLRITEDEAQEIINDPDPAERLVHVVEALRSRWKQEAEEAIELLKSLT